MIRKFYASVEHVSTVRCKHYSAPVIEVASLDELRHYVSQIPKRDEHGVFFRGQTGFYALQRTEAVKGLCFPIPAA